MTVSRGPMVLVLHLKRFAYGGYGSKITKHIEFAPTLTIPLSDDGGGASANYELCGVVVHHGHSVHSGHYVAYVKAPNQQWLEMDDNIVSSCSIKKVLATSAYILFYSRTDVPVDLENRNCTSDSLSRHQPDTQAHLENAPSDHSDVAPETTETPLHVNSIEKSTRLRQIASWMVRPIRFVRKGAWKWHKNRCVVPLRRAIKENDDGLNVSGFHSAGERNSLDLSSIPSKNGFSSQDLQLSKGHSAHSEQNVMNIILSQSKRARGVSTEGQWEDIDEDMKNSAKKIDSSLRRIEERAKQRKLPAEWDQLLDQGRIKKVKTKNKDQLLFDGRNPFQEKLDLKLNSRNLRV